MVSVFAEEKGSADGGLLEMEIRVVVVGRRYEVVVGELNPFCIRAAGLGSLNFAGRHLVSPPPHLSIRSLSRIPSQNLDNE